MLNRTSRLVSVLFLFFVVLSLFAWGCTEDDSDSDDDDDDSGEPARVQGRLVFPVNDADVENYPALGEDLAGHFTVSLDGEALVPDADGAFVFEDLASGEHSLSVACALTLSGGDDGCFVQPWEQSVTLEGGDDKDLGDIELEWGTGAVTITVPTGTWFFVDSGGNHSIWYYNNALAEQVMDRVFMESETTLTLSTKLHGEVYHHALRVFEEPAMKDEDHNGTLDDEQNGASFTYQFADVPLGDYILWTCPLVFAYANNELGAEVEASYFESNALGTFEEGKSVCASYSLDFSIGGVCQSKTVTPVSQFADESGEEMIRVSFDQHGQSMDLGDQWSFGEPEKSSAQFLPIGFNSWEEGEPVFESMCKDDTMPDR